MGYVGEVVDLLVAVLNSHAVEVRFGAFAVDVHHKIVASDAVGEGDGVEQHV